MKFYNRSAKKQHKFSRSMQHRLMLGASVAALLLATPAMAGEGDDDEGCSRNSTVITCNEYFGWQNGEGGPFGWGVHADEVADGIATTAVNATNLEGNFSSHGPLIEIRQNGDVAVTTSGGNWTEQWLEVAGDTGTFTLQQIKDVAAGDANAPDDEGIETLFSSLDTDNDGIITTETLFHFFATEWVGEALGHGDGGVEQERASLEQVRRMLPDYVSEADRNAFLATLEVDANGTVEVASTTVAVTQFISENFDLNQFVAIEQALLENNGPGAVIQVQSNTGTVNINNGVDLTSGDVGIKAGSVSGDVIVINSGTVNADDDGIKIRTEGSGSATLTNSGDITSGDDAIKVWALGDGAASANNSGSIAASDDGIKVWTQGSGNATLDNSGNVEVTNDGIKAWAEGTGSVTATNSGDISSGGAGIKAWAEGSGSVTVINSGDINAGEDGIFVESFGAGALNVDNAGDIASGGSAIEVWSGGSGDVSIINSGSVSVSGDHNTAIAAGSSHESESATPGDGNVTVNNAGAVNVSGDGGVGIEATSRGVESAVVNVTTEADIIASGENSHGILTANDGSAINITVGEGATVQGGSGATEFGVANVLTETPVDHDGDGIADGVNYDSNGHLTGSAGVIFIGGGENILNNAGTITALNGQAVSTFSGDLVFQDYDFESHDWSSGEAPAVRTNTVTFAVGNETVNNTGTITGDINLGEGTNSFANSGTVTGDVTTGDGNDTYQNDGTHTGNVALGSGTNSVTNTSSETLNGNVSTGDGVDAYNNSGAHNGNVDLGGGNNVASNSGTLTGNVTTGSGDDTLNNSGSVAGDANLGGGGNFFSNLLGGLFGGNVTTGDGDDEVVNAGTIEGDLALGDGANTLTNAAGSTLTGNVTTGSGADGVTNAGRITGNVDLGDGTNSFENAGILGGNFQGGADVDGFANAGVLNGNVALGEGANTYANSGAHVGDVSGGAGDDSFANSGVFEGNVELGGGTNTFSNLAGGTWNSGTSITLGGATLNNAGALSPGGTGVVTSTTIEGNYNQAATGSYIVDINDVATGQTNDLITVTGDADLSGTIVPYIMSLATSTSSSFTILTAANVTDNGLGVADPLNVTDTLSYDFELEYVDGDVILQVAPNRFEDIISGGTGGDDSAGTTAPPSQTVIVVAQALDAALSSEGSTPEMQALAATIRTKIDAGESVKDVVERLAPQSQTAQAGNAVGSAASFGNAMLSCQTRGGQYAYTREGQCYWGKLAYRKLDRDATSDMTGVDENSVELMGGVQVALWDDVRLGFALGYEKSESTSKSTTQTLGETDGQRIQGGFVLKNQWGPVNAYLNLAGSFGRYDSERSVLLTGPTDIAKGEQDIASAMSRLRLSYLVDMGSVYLRPMVDLSATYINLGGYTETGSSANMAISETDTWMLSVAPSIELGGEFRTAGNTVVRPYVRAGATFLNTDELSVSANFANAPVGVTPFLITGKIEDVYADVEAGMHFLTDNGLNLRFTYDGRFAEHSQQHAGSVKVGVKY